MRIGVLALQGAFIEHILVLKKLGIQCKEIRKREDLDDKFDGIILPGGESTTMGKLLIDLGMLDILRKMIEDGMPVFGTCAGLILLAKKIDNDERVHLSTMNIEVLRNAYGRQLASFNTEDYFDKVKIEMPFIRAPFIKSVGEDVEVLAVVDGNIVAAREKNQLVCAFHPELTDNFYVHKYFLEMCKNK